MNTVDEFICDIMEIVVKNPQHLVRIRSTAGNPFCSAKELKLMLEHPVVVPACLNANLFAEISEDDESLVTIGLGYADVVADHIRQYYARRRGLVVTMDIFKETAIFVPCASGFELAPCCAHDHANFIAELEVGKKVRCTIHGTGVVTHYESCAAVDDTLEHVNDPRHVATVKFGKPGNETNVNYVDGCPIFSRFIGCTLRDPEV